MRTTVSPYFVAVLSGLLENPHFEKVFEQAEENIDVAIDEFVELEGLSPEDARTLVRQALAAKWLGLVKEDA